MDRRRTGGIAALSASKVSEAKGKVSVVSTRASSPEVALVPSRSPTTSKYGGASPRGSVATGLFGVRSLYRRSEISMEGSET